jgi:hypothetical protein
MDHWALLMIRDQEPQLLQATSPQYQLAQAPCSFSGEVHACRLLVLLLRGGSSVTGVPCSCVLAAGDGGTS